MLVMNDTNVSFNAVSQDADGEVIATMSASAGTGSTVYFSLTVEKNSEDVDTDFAEFKKKVLASVASMQ